MTNSPMSGSLFPPQPGTWVPGHYEGRRTAYFVCPKCGSCGCLGTHEIARDGAVDPPVACPSCDFIDPVKLEGWIP